MATRTGSRVQGGGPWASYVAGATAAIGAQAALFERTCTGRGQLVDVAAMEAVAAAHQWSLTMYTHTGVVKRRWGGRLGESFHPMSLYECSDGWVCVCAPLPDQWERLCVAVDQVELLLDERLMAPAERFDRAEEIDRALQPWFSARRADEAVEALQAARVPAGRANTFFDVLAAEQLAVRHFWARAPWLGADAMMPAAPFCVGDRGCAVPSALLSWAATPKRCWRRSSATPERSPFPRIDLHRLTAIETTVGWAGPLTARFLADLGVDVIKLEHPAGRGVSPAPPPDPTWLWGTLPDPQLRAPVFPNAEPGERWWNRMGVWNKINRNKRDVALDLKTDEGREVLAHLIERADIVIHNFTPRAAASMGLDAAGVARHNARTVTILMSGYGETGPLASHASWGPILEAYAGFDEATGYSDGGPMRLGLAFPDAGGGLHGAFAALAGVWERERTNRSVHVDLSQLETLLSMAGESTLVSSVTRTAPVRMGNRSAQYAPQGCYRCAGNDAWVAVSVRSDHEWAALVALVDALADVRDLGVDERTVRHDEIDAVLSSWTASLFARRRGRGPAGRRCPSVPSVHQSGISSKVSTSRPEASWSPGISRTAGRQTFPGFPIHFERTAIPIRPAPPLGGDNVDVLTWLGYDLDDDRPAARAARHRRRAADSRLTRRVGHCVLSGHEANGQVLEAEQAVVRYPGDVAGALDAHLPSDEQLQHDADLEAGEAGAEAEVGAPAETEMRIRRAADVEPERLGEHRLVAVGRHLPERDLVTGGDADTRQRHRAAGRAPLVDRRCRPAHDLLDRRGDQRRVSAPAGRAPPATARTRARRRRVRCASSRRRPGTAGRRTRSARRR